MDITFNAKLELALSTNPYLYQAMNPTSIPLTSLLLALSIAFVGCSTQTESHNLESQNQQGKIIETRDSAYAHYGEVVTLRGKYIWDTRSQKESRITSAYEGYAAVVMKDGALVCLLPAKDPECVRPKAELDAFRDKVVFVEGVFGSDGYPDDLNHMTANRGELWLVKVNRIWEAE